MRHLFEPRLVNPSGAEPGLAVDFRDERRTLLFDLGELSRLRPRDLLRVSHAFVTHTHMDHFAGFDHLLAVVLGRHERFTVFGGPGFVDQVEHKLRAYSWNVVHRYEVPLTIEVRALSPDGMVQGAAFDSRTRFAREDAAPMRLADDTLHDEATFRVRARFVDHDIPCLAYAIEEKARVNVARDRLAALGLTPGPWLRELKQSILAGAPPGTPLVVRWTDRDGVHERPHTVGELAHVILDVAPGRRVGYATDLRGTEENARTLAELFDGVEVLFIESVFLEADREHAARKNHLTARQAGGIARRAGARALVPFHFSPRYEGREAELVAEARAAWRGEAP
jgi:ribonuclease Z